MRIEKAQEYGAAWLPDWSEDVQYILLDRELEYSELLKHLKLDSIPVKFVSIANWKHTNLDSPRLRL
jgi:hypothetical protein